MKIKDLESLGLVFTKEEVYDENNKSFIVWKQCLISINEYYFLKVIIDVDKVDCLIVHRHKCINLSIENLEQFKMILKVLKCG